MVNTLEIEAVCFELRLNVVLDALLWFGINRLYALS